MTAGRAARGFSVVLAVWILASCQEQEEEGLNPREATRPAVDTLVQELDRSDDFPPLPESPPDTLELRRSLVDPGALGQVITLRKVGAFLILGDALMPPHVKIVDLESGAIVEQVGPDGEGPGELRYPIAIEGSPGPPVLIEVFGGHTQRLYRWRLDPAERVVTLSAEVPFRTDGVALQPRRFGGGFLVNGRFGLGMTLLVTDTLGAALRGLYLRGPYTEDDAPAWVLPNLNGFRLAARPGSPQFALAYGDTNRIDILVTPDGLYRTVAGPRGVRVEFETHTDPNRIDYTVDESAYLGLATTRRYIYALFSGYSSVGFDPANPQFPRRVHVFEWDGDFVAELTLDRGIRNLDVSEDDRYLWGPYEDPLPRGSGSFRTGSGRGLCRLRRRARDSEDERR